MEFLDGQTLSQLVNRSGSLGVDRTIHILKQAAGSLREAHAAGIGHRDIKPQNLMLCNFGGEIDFLKVLDFGLVKQLTSDSHAASTVLAGTPRYMSPERLLSPNELDLRSDLYALGAVAYYLLSGHEIFAEVPQAKLLQAVLQELPKDLAQLATQPIPSGLQRLVADLLAKKPDDRPKNAQELLDRLNRIENPTK